MKATELKIGSIVSINNPENYPECKDLPMQVLSIVPISSKGQETYIIGLESLCEKKRYYQQFIEFIELFPLTEDSVVLDENTPVSMLEYNAAVSSLSETIEDLRKHIAVLQEENMRLVQTRRHYG